MKNKNGITLIALVITIIVLLILAGVSLSLVAGGDGILGRAENAVDTHNEAQIKEEIELAMAELKTQYYQERYADKTTKLTWSEYAKEKLESEDGIPTTNGAIKLNKTDGKTITYTGTDGSTINGTFNQATGEVTITGEKTEESGTEETPQVTEYTLSYDANGGTGELPADTEYEENTEVTISFPTITKEGFEFIGWATTDDATTAEYTTEGSTLTITKNVTLYAVWEEDNSQNASEIATNISNALRKSSNKLYSRRYNMASVLCR